MAKRSYISYTVHLHIDISISRGTDDRLEDPRQPPAAQRPAATGHCQDQRERAPEPGERQTHTYARARAGHGVMWHSTQHTAPTRKPQLSHTRATPHTAELSLRAAVKHAGLTQHTGGTSHHSHSAGCATMPGPPYSLERSGVPTETRHRHVCAAATQPEHVRTGNGGTTPSHPSTLPLVAQPRSCFRTPPFSVPAQPSRQGGALCVTACGESHPHPCCGSSVRPRPPLRTPTPPRSPHPKPLSAWQPWRTRIRSSHLGAKQSAQPSA